MTMSRGSKVKMSSGRRWPVWLAVAMTIAALTLLYFSIFALTTGGAWPMLLRDALANALPTGLAGWGLAIWVAPMCWPIGEWRTKFFAALAIVAYAMLIYVATLLLLALLGDGKQRADGLLISYFRGPAFIWQSFQGLAYGLIAMLCGWLRLSLAESERTPEPAQPTPLGRILLRTDIGIVPVEADDVIRIMGADDYCEVVTTKARHLVRMTMAECATLVASEPMLRIHRSQIISLRHMITAEPSGDGRMLVLLANGDRVNTSRAGAKLLRERSG